MATVTPAERTRTLSTGAGVKSDGLVMNAACSTATKFPRKTVVRLRSSAHALSRIEAIVFTSDLSVPPVYEREHGELLLQERTEE